MRRKKYACFWFFVFSVVFLLPLGTRAATNLCSNEPIPSAWTKAGSPYVICATLNINTPVSIEPGVVVKFKQAASATFNNSLTAIGTEEEKIVFTAWTDDENGGDTNEDLGAYQPKAGYWYRILIGSNANAHLENTRFLYGGEHPWGTLSLEPNNPKSVTVKSSEFRHNKYAGIYINYNPDQTIENNIFSDNAEGIALNDCIRGVSLTASKNFFEKNVNYGAKVKYPNYNKIYAQGNWWGSWTGPYHSTLNPDGKGDRVSNGVIFDPWIGKDGPDPAIIIPGIMGSWEKDGVWQIDPIFHTYDNLIEAFISAGYENDGKGFSVFPYQWRDSNIENAKLLHKRIQKIKEDTGRPKVDIVAHSMGGLLAREYIESDYFENDVDQLITVGTPHLGAPKDYVTWEAGEFMGIWSFAFKKIMLQEAKEKGYSDIFSYIHERPMNSVEELLPVYNYLYDENRDNFELRNTYPDNYPRNEFLENLNSTEKTEILKSIEFTKIVGETTSETSTIAGYNVIENNIEGLWADGYPKFFDILVLNRKGIVRDSGDGTVPIYSSRSLNIPDYKTKIFQSGHNNLPTDAQKDILEILTGKRPTKEVKEWRIDDILIGMVFSPVDIQIVSPSGKQLGKNFETGEECNEIEGAYYTGFQTNTEFLTIPNPENGEYKILTEGTGEGRYEIEIAKVTEDEENDTEESSETITGVAEPGKKEEIEIKITGKKVEMSKTSGKENKDPKGNNQKDDAENSSGEKENKGKRNGIQKLDGLKGSVRHFFKTGQVKTRKESRIIGKKLGHIRVHLKRYETENKERGKRRQKSRANRHIKNLIFQISRDYPKKIDTEGRDYLVGILEELKIE